MSEWYESTAVDLSNLKTCLLIGEKKETVVQEATTESTVSDDFG